MESGKESQPAERTVAERTFSPLLERVAEFYHKVLFRGSRGLKHLAGLALEEAHLLESNRIGHCDGTLAEILPASDPKRQELQRLGLLVELLRADFLS